MLCFTQAMQQYAVLSPHVVSSDSAAFDCTCYIHVDNQPCFPAQDMLDALLLLVPMYYVLWLSYPRKASALYQYIQQKLLGLKEHKVPSKLCRILARLQD